MSQPFVGEIRIVGFNFAPRGWAFCNGQLLPISQNTALFSLLGTYYGGDGRVTFGLPNFAGSAPIQQGQGQGLSLYDLGQTGGETAVTLLSSEMPAHNHTVNANSNTGGDKIDPTNNVWSSALVGRQGTNLYKADTPNKTFMHPLALALTGSGQPHNNMPPYLTLNFVIAMQGIFPQRS
jgi:microcystin-dependent protein